MFKYLKVAVHFVITPAVGTTKSHILDLIEDYCIENNIITELEENPTAKNMEVIRIKLEFECEEQQLERKEQRLEQEEAQKAHDAAYFSISPISISEVSKWLSTLILKKATGHDGISASCLLRSISPVIINTLCEIVNTSISSGKFPAICRKALAKPLHKSGPVDLVNNYRPISILCVALKLLEFHVHTSKC